MKTSGIRIYDSNNNILAISLSDILEEIPKGSSYYWALLFIDGSPEKGCGHFFVEYKNKVNHSEKGLLINFDELNKLDSKFFQIYEVRLLASMHPVLLRRYMTEEEMYKKCELVIELIDCSFWEVHAHKKALILNLQKKFQQTKLLY